MALSNDERGWIMTCLSAVACVFGASIICVDIIIRQFPGRQNFTIQDSDSFLSVSLSLSFGVMLFSALYNMLPSSKKSLQDGGFSSKEASWIMVTCFIGGVVGIQVVSQVLHHFIPSRVVDCEHTHEAEATPKENGDVHHHDHGHDHDHSRDTDASSPQKPNTPSRNSSRTTYRVGAQNNRRAQSQRASSYAGHTHSSSNAPTAKSNTNRQTPTNPQETLTRSLSLQTFINAGVSQLASVKKPLCDANGSCYGYSEVCGKECFKIVSSRGGFRTGPKHGLNRPSMFKSATMTESTPLLHDISEEPPARPHTQARAEGTASTPMQNEFLETNHLEDRPTSVATNGHLAKRLQESQSYDTGADDQPEHRHHHHVPSNAFLSIGLQTSIAIALHKLPEGFITYATNHANPKLGVSVFIALFIHNITEGFALALPLYLAMNNRVKAMLVSFVLGGLSQPIGAGIAAIWLKAAGNGKWAPSDGVYGGMFAVIAGIMASVALQLFSESLDLTHSKNLCMAGAFTGMMILAISGALTA